MFKVLFNIGVGLSMLFGAGATGMAAVRSEDQLQGFLQQSWQAQSSQVASRFEQRARIQATGDSATLLQDRDLTRLRLQDGLRTTTRRQLCQQAQLRTANRTQLNSQAKSPLSISEGQGQNRP